MDKYAGASRTLSVVVPVFNEEEILEERIRYLVPELEERYGDFEIILSENGSVDRTKELALGLEVESVRIHTSIDDGAADYGKALVSGINAARNENVAILELDYLDLGFLDSAYAHLDDNDLVIGSKKLSPGIDQRPWKRRAFTWLYNTLLRWYLDVRLTETHGLKVFRKSTMDHITNGCVTHHAVWPSEFCIRASLDPALRVKEIPLTMPLREIRLTRINAIKRIRKTLSDIQVLQKALREYPGG